MPHKKNLSEDDTSAKFITPALYQAGWDEAVTHANNGAYWEAGFAEGLGRPVIYTCRKDVFEDPKTKPHFDANHYLTVVWDPADPSAAAEQLKTVIRVTLPTEAALVDMAPSP